MNEGRAAIGLPLVPGGHTILQLTNVAPLGYTPEAPGEGKPGSETTVKPGEGGDGSPEGEGENPADSAPES